MPQITQLPFIFFSQLFWLAIVFGIIFFGIGRGMLPKIQSTVDWILGSIPSPIAKKMIPNTTVSQKSCDHHISGSWLS